LIRTFYQNHLHGRWLLLAPVILLGLFYNLLWADDSSRQAPPRIPPAAEVDSALHDIDLERASRLEAEQVGSRHVVVQFGDDIAPAVRGRLQDHVEQASTEPVSVVGADVAVGDLDVDALVIGIGDTTVTRALIGTDELVKLGDEGYLLRSANVGQRSTIGVDGKSTAREGADDVGALYGAYALLEQLGFGFLHPLEPTPPLALPGKAPAVDRASSPRWPQRGLQLHTMHPLELTDMLQGWGPGGPTDKAGWEASLDQWDTFLEWMVANGQNRVHWVWLASEKWADFADSDERIERIERLVDRAHAFGIEVGLDVPLRLQQQNAARLVQTSGTLAEEVGQIEDGVDYVMRAGFDYLVTESGTTEFTAPDDRRMLAWMDALTATAEDDHGVPVLIKVHASTGQAAENFADPNTGEPINFNFLPHYADSRLGVLPHTVQHYALDDPAPTYGNQNFSHIRQFLQEQAGRRPTVWHPETAYWVSFDNDVPLFLPLYASRRVHDLRLLAGDEDAGRMGRGEHAGASMDGQMTFSSGWEWGYWLQEVVTARAAWNPHTELESDEEALRRLLEPVERVFGDAGKPLLNWLVDYTRAQQALLIEGRVDGKAPDAVARHNGQAYLQGWETWDDVSDVLADNFGLTHGRMQPERMDFGEMRERSFDHSIYINKVEPLLSEMDTRFGALASRLEALRDDVPANAIDLYEEFVDAAEITALRARQVRALYAYVDAQERGLPADVTAEHLQTARDALDRALGITAHRESHYRVDADQIAGWRDNPTAYPFTYLWTVRSLFYWQRDEAQAVTASNNPCLHNIIDPIKIGLGEGVAKRLASGLANGLGLVPALGGVAKCAQAPAEEPDFLPATWQAATK
jgi:hypothetical protein